jgi:hypothetical protein
LAWETEVIGENIPQRQFVHHKSHMTRPGVEPGPPRWEANDYPVELWRGYLSMALVGVGRVFSFLISKSVGLHGRVSARRKATTYTQNNTKQLKSVCSRLQTSRDGMTLYI